MVLSRSTSAGALRRSWISSSRWIDQWLAGESRLLATRIHQDLVRDYGFTGSYDTVRRYTERTRPRRAPKTSERFETAPGHQA
jgi:transposase